MGSAGGPEAIVDINTQTTSTSQNVWYILHHKAGWLTKNMQMSSSPSPQKPDVRPLTASKPLTSHHPMPMSTSATGVL